MWDNPGLYVVLGSLTFWLWILILRGSLLTFLDMVHPVGLHHFGATVVLVATVIWAWTLPPEKEPIAVFLLLNGPVAVFYLIYKLVRGRK